MQRFAVNWRANKDQELIISIGATLNPDASEEEIAKLKAICGHAIVPDKSATGIVHNKLEKMELMVAAKEGKDSFIKFNQYIYKGNPDATVIFFDN